MKKHAATLLSLMLVGLTSLVHAQVRTVIKAQVPFAFVANGKTMPAGECRIVTSNNGLVLSISSGTQHAYALANPDGSPTASKKTALVFHKYGDRYFLAGLKRDGKIVYWLPRSKVEGELQARNLPEEVFTLLASAQ